MQPAPVRIKDDATRYCGATGGRARRILQRGVFLGSKSTGLLSEYPGGEKHEAGEGGDAEHGCEYDSERVLILAGDGGIYTTRGEGTDEGRIYARIIEGHGGGGRDDLRRSRRRGKRVPEEKEV